MEIRIVVDEINYGEIVEKCIPLVRDKLKEKEGTFPKFISGIANLPPSMAVAMIEKLPQETKDEAVALLINKNKDKLIEKAEEYAKKNDITLKISDLIVEK
ncbi:MAG: hypothetical protein J6K17_08500 [Oscillospiraceae bacterium]|nr:hypothetical protein [Oscillospiraceae bacterium]